MYDKLNSSLLQKLIFGVCAVYLCLTKVGIKQYQAREGTSRVLCQRFVRDPYSVTRPSFWEYGPWIRRAAVCRPDVVVTLPQS